MMYSCLARRICLHGWSYRFVKTCVRRASFTVKRPGQVDLKQVRFRAAEAGDHEAVKVMCEGSLGGRDVLPARYLQYITDPHRQYYVALYRDRVVALIGGRVVDDGNALEANSGRALPGHPGLFRALWAHFTMNWIMKEHPHIKTFRSVVRDEKTALESPRMRDVPLIRDIFDLTWKVPISTVMTAINTYQSKFQADISQRVQVQNAYKDDICKIFEHKTFREKYLPNGLIVIESLPLNLDYKSNADIIMAEDNRRMFVSYDEQHEMEAVSFGTAVEMGVNMDTLRYSIDYYGRPSVDYLTAHTMRHISAIPAILEQSQTAKDVYVALFLTQNSFNPRLLEQFIQHISVELSLNRDINIPSDRQYLVVLRMLPET